MIWRLAHSFSVFHLGRRSLGVGERLVAPLDGEQVVRRELGDQVLDRDLVLGLRDVVISSVTHDRGDVAVLLEELRVAQLRYAVRLAGAVVVAQAERVADLVGDDVADQLVLQLLREREAAGAVVLGATLREVPHVQDFLDVVPENDVGADGLAGARVVHVRPHRVGDGFGDPADDRVARVLGIPVRVFGATRGILADDRVLEARLLERRLPVLDALFHGRAEALGDFRGEVERDRLDRLGHVLGGVFLLEAEAGDVLLVLDPGALAGVVGEALGEVADARVEEAALHHVVGQQVERVVD